jgi:hypothetical protein
MMARHRMILPRLAAFALSAMPLAAAAQQPPVAAVGTDPAITERAMALAHILNSEKIIIGTADSDEAALALVPQLTAANADLIALEKQFPGITLELARATLPITNRSEHERLPQLWQRQAALYAAHFTAPELDTLIAFYQSPTGLKLVQAMIENMHPKHALREAAQSPDMRFGAKSVIADIQEAVPDVLATMTAEDRAVLTRLASSGIMQKMAEIAPQTQQIALDWMAEEAPWEAAETDRVVAELLARRRKPK